MTVICGDSLLVLPTLDAESVDAIVCDPPYGLSFMGKEWDHGVPGAAFWREALRVAKPGAHLLAFGGTRTYHRLACAIEDAGWEIRDCLSWLYGSGFPKSHNLDGEKQGWGTALKPAHEPVIVARKPLSFNDELAILVPATQEELCRVVSFAKTDTHLSGSPRIGGFLSIAGLLSSTLDALSEHASRFTTETAFALTTDLKILKSCLSRITHACITGALSETSGVESDVLLADAFSRSVLAKCERLAPTTAGETAIALPAVQDRGPVVEGLPPNWEPIIVARKPLVGTVASNVAQYGTGAMNVDGCRIDLAGEANPSTARRKSAPPVNNVWQDKRSPESFAADRPSESLGRWPANVVLDEDAAAMLDAQTGVQKSGVAGKRNAQNGYDGGWGAIDHIQGGYGDSGGASRFFYTAKASRREREAGLEGMPEKLSAKYANGDGLSGRTMVDGEWQNTDAERKLARNVHPTVKPIALMRWLCRLVTPPNGLVLDPFTGSGSTGCAAVLEGFRFVGIEREPEYAEIARRRIAHWGSQRETPEPDLFSEAR